METRWLYTTSENFTSLREISKDTCVIPMGCIEKHGLHLPLGTDILQANHIAFKASQIEPVCIFPDFTFGDISENSPTRPNGSISLPVETIMLLLEQLCEQIARNGFKKIMIYNGHGGNISWLKTFLRKLDQKPHDFVVVVFNIRCGIMERIAKSKTFKGLNDDDIKLAMDCLENRPEDGHGGYSETSFMLATAPESVKMDRLGIISGKSRNLTKKYKSVGITIRDGGWEIDYPNWLECDEPIGCNERIGEVAVKLESERLAKAIKFLKDDQDLIKWNQEKHIL